MDDREELRVHSEQLKRARRIEWAKLSLPEASDFVEQVRKGLEVFILNHDLASAKGVWETLMDAVGHPEPVVRTKVLQSIHEAMDEDSNSFLLCGEDLVEDLVLEMVDLSHGDELEENRLWATNILSLVALHLCNASANERPKKLDGEQILWYLCKILAAYLNLVFDAVEFMKNKALFLLDSNDSIDSSECNDWSPNQNIRLDIETSCHHRMIATVLKCIARIQSSRQQPLPLPSRNLIYFICSHFLRLESGKISPALVELSLQFLLVETEALHSEENQFENDIIPTFCGLFIPIIDHSLQETQNKKARKQMLAFLGLWMPTFVNMDELEVRTRVLALLDQCFHALPNALPRKVKPFANYQTLLQHLEKQQAAIRKDIRCRIESIRTVLHAPGTSAKLVSGENADFLSKIDSSYVSAATSEGFSLFGTDSTDLQGVDKIFLRASQIHETAYLHLAICTPSLPDVPPGCITVPPVLFPESAVTETLPVTSKMMRSAPDFEKWTLLGYSFLPPPQVTQDRSDDFLLVSHHTNSEGLAAGKKRQRNKITSSDTCLPVLEKNAGNLDMYLKDSDYSSTFEENQIPPRQHGVLSSADSIPSGFFAAPFCENVDLTEEEKDSVRQSARSLQYSYHPPVVETNGNGFADNPNEPGSFVPEDLSDLCAPILSTFHVLPRADIPAKPQRKTEIPFQVGAVLDLWILQSPEQPIKRFNLLIKSLSQVKRSCPFLHKEAREWTIGATIEIMLETSEPRQEGAGKQYQLTTVVQNVFEDEQGLEIWKSKIFLQLQRLQHQLQDPDGDHVKDLDPFAALVPAGVTSRGTVFFSPPVNEPPLPAMYDSLSGIPLYGPVYPVRRQPVAVLSDGTRLYQRHVAPDCPAVLFTNQGEPLYLCQQGMLPKPDGYTPMGVPFYSALSVACHPFFINHIKRRNHVSRVLRALRMKTIQTQAAAVLGKVQLLKRVSKVSPPITTSPIEDKPKSNEVKKQGKSDDVQQQQGMTRHEEEKKEDADVEGKGEEHDESESETSSLGFDSDQDTLDIDENPFFTLALEDKEEEEEEQQQQQPNGAGKSSKRRRSTHSLSLTASKTKAALLSGKKKETVVPILFDCHVVQFGKTGEKDVMLIRARLKSRIEEEIRVFALAEPSSTFDVNPSIITFSPTVSFVDLTVSFDPENHTERSVQVNGDLIIQTFMGTRLAECELYGFCGPILEIQHNPKRQLWAEPGGSSSLTIPVLNRYPKEVTLELSVTSEVQAQVDRSPSSGLLEDISEHSDSDNEDPQRKSNQSSVFATQQRALKLAGCADGTITVKFFPGTSTGLHRGELVVKTSTGEVQSVPLEANCGSSLLVRTLTRRESVALLESNHEQGFARKSQRNRNSLVATPGDDRRGSSVQSEMRKSSILSSMKLSRRPTLAALVQNQTQASQSTKDLPLSQAWGTANGTKEGNSSSNRSSSRWKFAQGTVTSIQRMRRTDKTPQILYDEPSARSQNDAIVTKLVLDSTKVMATKTYIPQADPELVEQVNVPPTSKMTRKRSVHILSLQGTPDLLVNFGLINPGQQVVKYFAMQNLSSEPVLTGIRCIPNDVFRVSRAIVIPPQSSEYVKIAVFGQAATTGPVEAKLELFSPILNKKQVIHLTAFLGRALEIPVGPRVHFGFVPLGKKAKLTLPVLNHSQFGLRFVLLPFPEESCFSSSVGSDVGKPLYIPPFGSVNVQLGFAPKHFRGIYRAPLGLQVVHPELTTYAAAGSRGVIELVGVSFLPEAPGERSLKASKLNLTSSEAAEIDLNQVEGICSWIRGGSDFPGMAGQLRVSYLEEEDENDPCKETELQKRAILDEPAEASVKDSNVTSVTASPAGQVPSEMEPYKGGEGGCVHFGPIIPERVSGASFRVLGRRSLTNVVLFSPRGTHFEVTGFQRPQEQEDMVTFQQLPAPSQVSTKLSLSEDAKKEPLMYSFLAFVEQDKQVSPPMLSQLVMVPCLGFGAPRYTLFPFKGRSSALDFGRCHIEEKHMLRASMRSMCGVKTRWRLSIRDMVGLGHQPFVFQRSEDSNAGELLTLSGTLAPFEATTVEVVFAPQVQTIYHDSMLLEVFLDDQEVAALNATASQEEKAEGNDGGVNGDEENEIIPLYSEQASLCGVGYATSIEGLPDSEDVIEYGNIPIGTEACRELSLMNDGEVEEEIMFFSQPPFHCEPNRLVLSPEESSSVKIYFRPQEKGHFNARLDILHGDNATSSQLRGMGGYIQPRSTCKDGVLDFGIRFVGTEATAHVFITNRGTLPLAYRGLFFGAENPSKFSQSSFHVYFRGVLRQPNLRLTQSIEEKRSPWVLIRQNLPDLIRILKAQKNASLFAKSMLHFKGASRLLMSSRAGKTKANLLGGGSAMAKRKSSAKLLRRTSKKQSSFATFNLKRQERQLSSGFSDQGGSSTKSRFKGSQEDFGFIENSQTMPQHHQQALRVLIQPMAKAGRGEISFRFEDKEEEQVPPLRPGASWHFEVSFTAAHALSVGLSLDLDCHVWQAESVRLEESMGDLLLPETLVSFPLELLGRGINKLEISPRRLDFGFVPAMQYFKADAVGKKYGSELAFKVLNRSLLPQNLDFVGSDTSCFSVQNAAETLQPGEVKHVVVRFSPKYANTEYAGLLEFRDMSGVRKLAVKGQGAAANLKVSKEELRFDAVKMEVQQTQKFELVNHGNVPTRVKYVLSESAFVTTSWSKDEELRLQPNEEQIVSLTCALKEATEMQSDGRCSFVQGVMKLEWEVVPGGIWRTQEVHLFASLGEVKLELANEEDTVDFGLCTILYPTSRQVELRNSGTAPCVWSATNVPGSWLSVEPNQGVIGPGDSIQVTLTLCVETCDPVDVPLVFGSDGGEVAVKVRADVAAPKLIVPDNLGVDFGTILSGEKDRKVFQIRNVGRGPVDFELGLCHHDTTIKGRNKKVVNKIMDVWAKDDPTETNNIEKFIRRKLVPSASGTGEQQPSTEMQEQVLVASPSEDDPDTLEIKCFRITPWKGTLQGGESVLVSVSVDSSALEKDTEHREVLQSAQESTAFIGSWQLNCRQLKQTWSGRLRCLVGALDWRIVPKRITSTATSGRLQDFVAQTIEKVSEDEAIEASSICYFGVCTVGRPLRHHKSFLIENNGTVDIEVSFEKRKRDEASERSSSFNVSPEMGTLAPGETMSFDVEFTSSKEGFHRQLIEAVAKPANSTRVGGKKKKLLLCATSGMPRLLCTTSELDYGRCQLNLSNQKHLSIQSVGNCQALWTASILPLDEKDKHVAAEAAKDDAACGTSGSHTAFQLDVSAGVVDPQAEQIITVSFRPFGQASQDDSVLEFKALLVIEWAGEEPFKIWLFGEGAETRVSWWISEWSPKETKSFPKVKDVPIQFGVQPAYLGSKAAWKRVEIENAGALPVDLRITTDLPRASFFLVKKPTEAAQRELEMQIDRKFNALQDKPDVDREALELGRTMARKSIIQQSPQQGLEPNSEEAATISFPASPKGAASLKKGWVVYKRLELHPGQSTVFYVGFSPTTKESFQHSILIDLLQRERTLQILVSGQGAFLNLLPSNMSDKALQLGTVGLGFDTLEQFNVKNKGSLFSPIECQIYPDYLAEMVSVVPLRKGHSVKQYELEEIHETVRSAKSRKEDLAENIVRLAGKETLAFSFCVHPLLEGDFEGFVILRPVLASLPTKEDDEYFNEIIASTMKKRFRGEPELPPEKRLAGRFGLTLPFSFTAINNRLRLSVMHPFGFGRVPLGQTVKVVRKLMNSTDLDLEFEIGLQWPTGTSYEQVWSVEPNEGHLAPGEEVDVCVAYESVDNDAGCWHEAEITVFNKVTNFVDMKFSASASVGCPTLGLSTKQKSFHFGPCQLDTWRAIPIQIRNAGTGMLHVRPTLVPETWGGLSEDGAVEKPAFYLALRGMMNSDGEPVRLELEKAVGTTAAVREYAVNLQPNISHGLGLGEGIHRPSLFGFGVLAEGESMDLQIVFLPKSRRKFSFKLDFQTNCGTDQTIKLHGEGCSYELADNCLPEVIDIGPLVLGETKTERIELIASTDVSVPVKVRFHGNLLDKWLPPFGIGGVLLEDELEDRLSPLHDGKEEKEDNEDEDKDEDEDDKDDPNELVQVSKRELSVSKSGSPLECSICVPSTFLDRKGVPTPESAQRLLEILLKQPRAPKLRSVPLYIFVPGRVPRQVSLRFRVEPPRVVTQVSDVHERSDESQLVGITDLNKVIDPNYGVSIVQQLEAKGEHVSLGAVLDCGSVLLNAQVSKSIVLSINTPLKVPFEARVVVDKHPNSSENYNAFFRLSRKLGTFTQEEPVGIKLLCNFSKAFDSSKVNVYVRIKVLFGALPDVIVPVVVKTMSHVFDSDCLMPITFSDPVFVGMVGKQSVLLRNVKDETVKATLRFTEKSFSTSLKSPITMLPGQEQEVPIMFRPVSGQMSSGTMEIQVGDLVFSVDISGTGCLAALSLRPENRVDFGFIGCLLASRKEVIVRNTCALPLHLEIKSSCDEFIISPSVIMLESKASRAIQVEFRPIHEVLYEGTLSIEAFAEGNRAGRGDEDESQRLPLLKQNIELLGQGGRVAISVPDCISFGKISTHIQHLACFDVVNTGNVPIDVSLTWPEADTRGALKVSQSSLSLLPTQRSTITLSLTLTEEGQQEFIIDLVPLGMIRSPHQWAVRAKALGDRIKLSPELQRILENEELPLLEMNSDEVPDVHLDRVLAPVVHLPPTSVDHLVQFVEPIYASNEAVHDVVVRPPPLAVEPSNPVRARWFTNRVPFRLTTPNEYTFSDPMWARLQRRSQADRNTNK